MLNYKGKRRVKFAVATMFNKKGQKAIHVPMAMIVKNLYCKSEEEEILTFSFIFLYKKLNISRGLNIGLGSRF